MTDDGILLEIADGSMYFIPPDVLESCRLDGDARAQAEQHVAAAKDADVEGFVQKPAVLAIWMLGQAVYPSAQPLEAQAAAKEQQAGQLELRPSEPWRPGHMRL